MIDDKRLESILMKRDIPAPSTNLAHRITAAAMPSKEKKFDKFSITEQLLRLLVIPKPAYATSLLLVLGIAIGFYTNDTESLNQDWFSFLETQEEDWL